MRGSLSLAHLWMPRMADLSALARFADSSRTLPQGREVPKGDIPAICSFVLNGELAISWKWPIRG
jgi:hypothetical protein